MAKLGAKVRDRISGFEGIVTGRAEYLWGCVQILVNPGQVKDSQPVTSTWLDEDRCEVIAEQASELRPASADERRGGPVEDQPPSGSR